MISPIIICDGIIRSGSTWSFNVCRLLAQLLAKRRSQQCGIACLGDRSLDQFIQSQVYLGNGPAVVKAHQIGPVALDWIRGGRAKAVCTFRDPRDCVASDMVFWGDGFDASVHRVVVSLQSLHGSYLDASHTLLIRYEDMMSDRLAQVNRIAGYLEMSLEQRELEWIDAQTNLDSSRKNCQDLLARQGAGFDVGRGGHRRDRTTFLHDNHIGTAKVGRWKTELTPQQGLQLTQLFYLSLKTLGYDIPQSINSPPPQYTSPDVHPPLSQSPPLS